MISAEITTKLFKRLYLIHIYIVHFKIRNLQTKYDSAVSNSANNSLKRNSGINTVKNDRPLLAMVENDTEAELSIEAGRLKEDKDRLEKKMAKLEIYNKQLESQLQILKDNINQTVSITVYCPGLKFKDKVYYICTI